MWDLAKGIDDEPKFKRQDHTLMLELLKGFMLLRVLGAPCDAKLERCVVPAMLPNQTLPVEYITPEWWCPEKAVNAADAAIVRHILLSLCANTLIIILCFLGKG